MVCKTLEDKKIEIMNIQYNSLIQCTIKFLHWVIQVILKLFCLKLGPYSFTKFLYYNQKDLWLTPFLQVKVSVVNSAGDSFCWNYATDTFYSNYTGANLCCNYASFEVLLQLYWWYFPYSYVGGSFCCNYAGECFCCNYAVRSFCNIYTGERFCNKCVGENFYWNYALGSFSCNYAGGIFCKALCAWPYLL